RDAEAVLPAKTAARVSAACRRARKPGASARYCYTLALAFLSTAASPASAGNTPSALTKPLEKNDVHVGRRCRGGRRLCDFRHFLAVAPSGRAAGTGRREQSMAR